jgi:hypothetical protein
MRRQPSRLHRALAVGVAAAGSLVVACNLELTGLADIPLDASVPTTTVGASPDAATLSSGGSGGGTIGPTSGPPGGQLDDASSSSSEGGSSGPPVTADASGLVADGSTPPPPPHPDASTVSTDAGGVTIDCDQDGDGFRSTTDDCGGTDCCDRDARAFPGETDFFAVADACGSFDYNCNGQSEPEFGKVNCTVSGLSCTGDGFDGTPPACGATATFDTCHLFLLTCTTSQDQEAEACR